MTQFLSPAGLVQLFGRRAAVTHSSLSVLSGLLASQQDPAAINQWAAWQQVFQQAVGIPLDKLKLSQRQLYGLAEGEANLSRWLFAVQTYYALIVKLLAYRTIVPAMTVPMSPPACARFLMNIETGVVFRDAGIANFLETRDIFSWYLDVWTPALATQLTSIITRIAERQLPPTRHMPRDLLQQLYQDLLPPSLRHRLGEYYTPSWLATYLLDRIGYHGDPNTTLLDPSCGSGVFLACALNRLRQHGPDSYSGQIVGFDLNPLAVLSTRANYLLMLGNDAIQSPHHIPVYQMDTILDTPPENRRYDYVVGNPPWVNWQSLMPSYREKTRALWHHYRLFPHRDFESILGKGKKDLSLLMTMVALDCYLAETGRLGFVITAAVFKTAAGQGFREFGQGQGTPIEVIAVDDLSTIKPFAKAQNRTALVILGKGGQTTYPVPYTRWRLKPGAKRPSPPPA
ncbi:MAG: N-6 DNA methylase [Chloroflexi bacterium]|nr:N-6 DNA methylase [Chloroflexota bacterium]